MEAETLLSNWYNIQSVPNNYVLPPDERPGDVIVPPCKTIPVIDLGKAVGDTQAETIRQILQASHEFGFFQVINHGVTEILMDETMNVSKEFFDMPAEEKASVTSYDPNKSYKIYTSSTNHASEKYRFWKDKLQHACHPLNDYVQFWPEKPSRYREIVGTYSLEVRSLSMKILELICGGLGLEPGYFQNELSNVQTLNVNHYPPCPDPSLTLGIAKHGDPNLITILQQEDVCGLQVFKDGKWIGVEPVPNAFVVNIGYQLQIISNEKLRSAEHRAVTNSSKARTSIATFINPSLDCVIEPAKALVTPCNPPLYRAFQYKEFVVNYGAKSPTFDKVAEPFKLLRA